VSSIREIDGVWTKTRHRVGGFDLTLDAIEHNLLRPTFKDPRIHFAVNCASNSCAPLPGWAFDGNRLEDLLEERTRSFLTDPKNVRVDGDSLVVSRYFQWYGDDFTKEGWEPRGETIGGFIARYAARMWPRSSGRQGAGRPGPASILSDRRRPHQIRQPRGRFRPGTGGSPPRDRGAGDGRR
jgi:hypothetical protein